MNIIKLGGSVLTDKTQLATFKKEVMDELSKQLSSHTEQMILIHGAGSFGHITAEQYNLQSGFQDHSQLQGFSVTHALVQQLNNYVLESLHKANIPAVSLPPHAILSLDNHKVDHLDYPLFKSYLDSNFVPVSFGDVALDKSLGFSICSGDLLIRHLCAHFKPEKIIFVIDIDGLYTANPKTHPEAELIEHTDSSGLSTILTQADEHSDVTGGMQGKIESILNLLDHTQEVYLVNGNHPERLKEILLGNTTICTRIIGRGTA